MERPTQGRNKPPSKWLEYNRRKLKWVDEHPSATAKEYERAIKRIAAELGV